MKKLSLIRFLVVLSSLFTTFKGYTQIGIGTSTVNASAKLQVDASNQGFLPPRVSLSSTAASPNVISNPATGLLVYNNVSAGSGATAVTPGFYYFDGSKWQRVINQQPDATIEFNTADPNTGSPTFTPNTPASRDFIYVSTVNNSQWTYNGTNYVTYTPPASTPWYLSGGTNDAGSNKTAAIYRTGRVGIGTTNPGTALEVASGVANNSGLKFTNLSSATPTSGGATLGVDANGNVVTVQGSSFSPDFGSARPTSDVTINAGSSALLTQITINTTGTYLITYTMRVQPTQAVANQFAVGSLSLDNINPIVGTEILGAFPGNATVGAPGGNYSGSHVITINTVPTIIYFRGRAVGGQMGFLDDANGRTKMTFVKITP